MMDTISKYDHAKFIIDRFDQYLNIVNSKGSFYIGVNTFILGAVFTGVTTAYKQMDHPGYLWWVLGCFAACSLTSIICTITAINPYLVSGNRSSPDRSLLFFGSVCELDKATHKKAFLAHDDGRILEDAVSQSWVLVGGLVRGSRKLRLAGFKIVLVGLLGIYCQMASAQLFKYSPTGKRIEISGERTVIAIDPESDHKSMAGTATLSLPSLIPGVASTLIDVVKTAISHQQEKYTATYTGSQSQNGLVYLQKTSTSELARLNIRHISIDRYTDKSDTALHLGLVPEVQGGAVFRLRLDELYMPFANAKVRKTGKAGKTIDLNIDIKIEAFWKEANAKTPVDSSVFDIKTATLGQSSILVTGVRLGDRSALDQKYYSNWFQLIPKAALKYASAETDWMTGWYVVIVSIKEASPYALTPKQLSDFLTGASPDVLSLLKQIFTTNAK